MVLLVGSTTIVLLAIMLIALIRHLKLLTASLRRFQDEVRPALERLNRDSGLAQERLERLSREGLRRGAGARIPRQRGT